MKTPDLPEFLALLKSGDGRKVQEVLTHLAPSLRQIIHLRLIDGRLRHVVDTTDILQSLLKDFLTRSAADRPPAEHEGGLRAYLGAAARNKIRTRARKESRHPERLPDERDIKSDAPGPIQRVADRDLLQTIRTRLSASDQQLFDLKAQGLTWPEIAERVGGQHATLRIRLGRAVKAVLRDLKLSE